MMPTIIEAPFQINIDEHCAALRLQKRPKDQEAFADLVAQVVAVAKPKAIFKVAYIGKRHGATIEIEDVTFTSSVLGKNLADVNRIFPFIATCGTEVDQIKFDADDLIKSYWLSALKETLLEAALQFVFAEVKRSYQIEQMSAMNPGSGEATVWPLEQQTELFSLFGDVENLIGVRLLPSYLMLPEMTVSGIFFQSETTFHSCQLCQRANCPGRLAEFDCEMWATLNP